MDEQRTPIEDGHDDATDADRIAGIVEQTRSDIALGHVKDAHEALRERLNDAGIDLDDEEFAQLVAQL